ncbi:Aquaporin [Caenorhabditis elegans]|nr:Aquaporin [Caenorhabditis elegans]CBY25186.1 Aquaporin [Caenorhabditis elegans]|eukprot:NP_001251149.1 Aquaporin [Caenorhabditis elegans]
MYANPIVAWACTFNCLGVSHAGHLFVYWLSPLIAWYFAEIVFGSEDVLEEESEEQEKDTKKKE